MKSIWYYVAGLFTLLGLALKYYMGKAGSLGAQLKIKDLGLKEVSKFDPSDIMNKEKTDLNQKLDSQKNSLENRTPEEIEDFWKKN